MDAAAIVFVLIALIVGAALGWLWASRESAGARQTVENLRLQLDEVVKERDSGRAAGQELAALKAAQEEREKSFQQQIAVLKDAKESLSAQFHEIAGKLLGDARKSFLDQAGEKFTQAVSPVETLLKTYQEKLQTIEKERVDHYAGLREAVDLVRTGQGQVRDETRHLVNALRASPKARGRWGEQSLRNVLEQAGLTEHVDFQTEVSIDTDEGRLRPDVIVRLPGGRNLVIDAKCSLNAYLDACDEVDDEKRQACFRAHVASMRTHAQQLGSKAYWAQFGDAADYVIMYIPGEQFLAAALEQDSNSVGLGVRTARAARDPDQLGRHRQDRRKHLAAGAASRSGAGNRQPWQGIALSSCDDERAYDAGRQEPLDRDGGLQPDGRQLRKPGAEPGQAFRDARSGQRQDARHAADGRNRAAAADQDLGESVERRATADRRGIAPLAK